MAQQALSNTNLNKIETLQRKVIRMITPWPRETRASVIYTNLNPLYKLEPIKTRIQTLFDKYLGKAYPNLEVIKELINQYNKATSVREGALLRRKQKPKKTILGRIKEAQTPHASTILIEAPYPCTTTLYEAMNSSHQIIHKLSQQSS